jgi:tubulin polyglutamylase TTLL6/13
VVKKHFHWRLSNDPEDFEFDLWWTDGAVQPEKLARMKPYQKINHFPGMYGLARKNYLARNLNKLRKLFPQEYDFYPQTWVLPAEHGDLKTYSLRNPRTTYIVKPEASCQGRGIFLTRTPESLDLNAHYVVQRYLEKPLLLEDLKFDLRVYVLVAGCDPLRIFVHEEGLARLATMEYSAPNAGNLGDACMHLTNYAVNKHNPNFVFNEDEEVDDIGHKRSLTSTMEALREQGWDVSQLRSNIHDLIVKTLCSIQPSLAHIYKSCQPEDKSNSCCFELLGFDIILDQSLKPWLLEVNHSPSFSTDTPLDKKIKRQVIAEALELMDIHPKHRRRYIARKKIEIQQRAVLGKNTKESKEERALAYNKAARLRDKWESKHLGAYVKAYPGPKAESYEKYIRTAGEIWEEWTGGNINRVKKEDLREIPLKPPRTSSQKPSKSLSKPSTEKVAKSPSSASVSNREKRSQSVSERPEIQPMPAVFERLSKVKGNERRVQTPIAVLPSIYLTDDLQSATPNVPAERLYRSSIDPPQYSSKLIPLKDPRGKQSLVATLEASLRQTRPDLRMLQIPLKIQALDTFSPATWVQKSPDSKSPLRASREGRVRKLGQRM